MRDCAMQIRTDELMQFICQKGKIVLNQMVKAKLSKIYHQIALDEYEHDPRAIMSLNLAADFKEDSLSFMFTARMGQYLSFENKKMYLDIQVQTIRNQNKKSGKKEILELAINKE